MKRGVLFLALLVLPFYDVYAQMSDWVLLPEQPNSFVDDLVEYDGKLIACGHFTQMDSLKTNLIAAWDNNSWSPLGSGLRGGNNPFVYEGLAYDGKLYVVGNFDSAGDVSARNVAVWDGVSWSPLGTGLKNVGYAIEVYGGEIYVGGIADSMAGTADGFIARWNGSDWVGVGEGVHGYAVRDLCVFNNELYATGNFDSAGSVPSKCIARWDGASWSDVPPGIDWSIGPDHLIVWNNKLIIGSNFEWISNPFQTWRNCYQFDGATLDTFSKQTILSLNEFYVFNNQLYSGLNSNDSLLAAVNVWNGIQWEPVGTLSFTYAYALCAFDSMLYCGALSSISRLEHINTVATLTNNEKFGIVPNPSSNFWNVSYGNILSKRFDVELYDVLGKIHYRERIDDSRKKLVAISNENLCNGTYLLKITTDDTSVILKAVKQ